LRLQTLKFVRIMNKPLQCLIILSLFASCTNSNKPDTTGEKPVDNSPPAINYSVVRTLPHDTTSFTEGFLFHNGELYESTGTEPNMPESRRSMFGVVDPKTGKIDKKAELDRSKYFGEGITFLKDKVYQLTWQTRVGFIYDAKSFKPLGQFPIPAKEGWGMTTDGTNLIISDGTSNISYVDPTTFRLVKVIGVTDNNGPVSNINELEMINGFIYANQWQTNYILKIDTASGKVVGRLDLDGLSSAEQNKYAASDTMNGIAYDSTTGKVYITGKLWPDIYEIKFNL